MILYKYYPCSESTFKAIAARGLWCHYPIKMNDPFECLTEVTRRFSAEKIEKFRNHISSSSNPTLKKLVAFDDNGLIQYFHQLRKKIINKWAFCALSEVYDDILMWSHYSNCHKGIVIGFEFDGFNNRKVFQQVNYCEVLPDYDMISWAKFIEGDDSELLLFISDMSVKFRAWHIEKEWRIWGQDPGYYPYKPHEVKEVYFGINCDMDTKNVVFNLMRQYLPEDFKYYEMEFRDNPIRLVRE